MKHKLFNKPIKDLRSIEKEVNKDLFFRYKTDENTYNNIVINDIIYNEKTRLVATFKDYLILDDISEFLRRVYSKSEAYLRLPKIIGFYEAYSKIFPNYITLPESKYLYKNIRKKQKMIDAFNQIKIEEEENRKQQFGNNLNGLLSTKKKKNDKVFDTEIRNSILKYKPSYMHFESNNNENKSRSTLNLLDFDEINNKNTDDSFISITNMLNMIDKTTNKKKKRNIGL